MKILFIHPSVELYGADKILLYLLDILKDSNDITVLLPKEGILIEKIKNVSNNISIVINEHLPIVHSKIGIKGILKLPLDISRISKIFKKNEFDIVYCNTLATVGFLYVKWAKKRIIHVHEIIENSIINLGFSFLVRLKTTNVFCVSRHVKERLRFSKNYKIILNGIPDIKNDEPITANSNKIRFVLPGRYMPKKGQWFLLESLKRVKKELIEQSEFFLYGSPPPNRMELETELRNEIEKLDFKEHIHVSPFLSEINKIYTNADVVLVPSIMADPFPTTVLEALMFSKPVITTNNGGASEIVDESFGLLVKPNDYDALAKSIEFYIENKDTLQDFGKKARDKFINNFTIDCFKERFLREFNSI